MCPAECLQRRRSLRPKEKDQSQEASHQLQGQEDHGGARQKVRTVREQPRRAVRAERSRHEQQGRDTRRGLEQPKDKHLQRHGGALEVHRGSRPELDVRHVCQPDSHLPDHREHHHNGEAPYQSGEFF